MKKYIYILSILLVTITVINAQTPTIYPRIYDESTWGPIAAGTKYVWNSKTCQDCETLSIGDGELGNMLNTSIDHNNRIIPEKTLAYRVVRQVTQYKVNEMIGLNVDQALDQNFNKISTGAGYYAKLTIFDNQFVALNGKANKFVRLIFEQGTTPNDSKDLVVGETWNIGDGYILTVQSIDARTVPKQVWLVLTQNGVKKDDKIIPENRVYTYVERSIAGETDVPLFVTYIDSIYTNGTTNIVRLRYTWLASSNNFMIVNSGDGTGSKSVFRVKDTSDNQLVLWNENSSINLSANSTVRLIDRLKFVIVDDINNLKFYPFIDNENIGPLPEEGNWTQNPLNGHYYKLTVPMHWSQAEYRAVSLGGHLVTINDEQEELWLRTQFGTNELFWIGFNDLRIEGNWEWSSGEPVTYTNWNLGEPNNNAGNGVPENAAVMNWGEGYPNGTIVYGDNWNDVAGGVWRGIVETPFLTGPIITRYDTNVNGMIDKSEAISALTDYFSGTITKQQAIAVLMAYFRE